MKWMFVILAMTAGLSFCFDAGAAGTRAAHQADHAIAVVHSAANQNVHGVVKFASVRGGVRITAELHGLKPDSRHGFHIHEYGDCSAADFSSAGGHYNPQQQAHGAPGSRAHHAGDLGNVKADANGDAQLDLTVHGISIDGRRDPILGRAIIVHAQADDLKSQPSGDAGARIGCGVIGLTGS